MARTYAWEDTETGLEMTAHMIIGVCSGYIAALVPTDLRHASRHIAEEFF